ncbi:mitochondrial import inner membrane translocase subunit Tim29 [Coturnix japonica]|nr:mitochondrial import inner membrane translocase subunit Tim29 [Coturnix japonica]
MVLTTPPLIGRWFRAVLRDYTEALWDTLRWARRRPVAAGSVLVSMGGAVAAIRTVPDRRSFDAALLDAASALLLLPPNTRNMATERHVQRLQRRRDRGQLRYRQLVLLAVLYEEPHDAAVALYGARCPHVRPRWKRVWDVGFAGRWWVLEAKLQDCDINDEEFAALPDALQRVRPEQLHSDGTERLRERRERPTVLMPRGDDGD